VLYEPRAHEPLVEVPWNAARVRDAIRAIAADAEAAFDDGWDGHPLDQIEGRPRAIYLGGAGVVDGLRRLRERGLVDLGRDYVPYLERSLEAPPDFPDDDGRRSLWVGETGIRLLLQRLSPSAENLHDLAALIAANARDERCELMWGSPGTMLAARELALDDLWAESADWLRGERDADGVWEQHLYGQRRRYLGPAHGFAGCVLALGDDPPAARVARRYAVEENGLANWPALAGGELVPGDGAIRTQWCHGAPGMITSLGNLLDEDLALAGGELVWRAGPLAKGASLCHGTAGNGYAFLVLFARTADERWLVRARAFAVHAVAQVEQARSTYGRGRHTLWTGDLGTALYLADCLDGGGTLPLP
jgi:Lanthionine synthetase C-like protein